jgi:hypothetical protein
MKIREGAYYRTRGGDVVGPICNDETTSIYPLTTIGQCWTICGRFSANSDGPLDLISEVYVSDTPPADAPAPPSAMLKPQDWRRLKPIEPSPETKTLRDEFAMAALTGLLAAGDCHAFNSKEMAAEAYRQADAMMEAREK